MLSYIFVTDLFVSLPLKIILLTDQLIQNKTWNTPAEYPSWECKHDVSEGLTIQFNPVFSKKVPRAEESLGGV